MTVSHQSHFKSSKESRPIHRSFGLFFKVWKIQIPFSQKVNARCPSWGFMRLTLHEQRTMKNHKEPCLKSGSTVQQAPLCSIQFSSFLAWLQHRLASTKAPCFMGRQIFRIPFALPQCKVFTKMPTKVLIKILTKVMPKDPYRICKRDHLLNGI